ncbi:MAG TPA: Pycsar system effector family protein [Cytophagaceae bacterium]
MQEELLVEDASRFIFRLFKEKLSKDFVYHNYQHTFETVEACKRLAKECELSEEEREILLLAAWFHDAGYSETYKGHEQKSKEIARAFLEKRGYAEEKIAYIEDCIEATKRNVVPTNLLCQLLCDADLSNLGDKSFFAKAELLRTEWENFNIRFCSEVEWAELQLDFLTGTVFHTECAQRIYGGQKEINIQEQRYRLRKLVKKQSKKSKSKFESKAQPKRGIETMFRSLYRNHINLSSIADSKANMMININALIISITLTVVGAKFSVFGTSFKESQIVIYPIIALLLTSLVSITFGILSAKPKVTAKIHNFDQILNEHSSILFFGNFTHIPIDRFEDAIKNLMKDEEQLYGNMIRDLYHLGKVLNKKYKLLSMSYMSFMLGLIVTVIVTVFVIVYLKKTD